MNKALLQKCCLYMSAGSTQTEHLKYTKRKTNLTERRENYKSTFQSPNNLFLQSKVQQTNSFLLPSMILYNNRFLWKDISESNLFLLFFAKSRVRKKKETKNGDKRVRDRAGESKKDGKEDEGNKEFWLKQKQNKQGDSRMTNWVGKGKRKVIIGKQTRWLWKKVVRMRNETGTDEKGN